MINVKIIIPEGLSPGGMVNNSPKLENKKPPIIIDIDIPLYKIL
jgi:hypothetical protein